MAGVLWYGLAIAIVVGAIFAGGLGGALAWVLFWLVVAIVAYLIVSNTWGSIS